MMLSCPRQKNARFFSQYQPWFVCVAAALFFFYEFIQMGMFNSISQELMHDFSITASQLGFLSATYFYADVIFLLFAGILVDRFSVRTIMLIAMAMVVMATFIFALSHTLILAAVSHFVAGIGNAFCFLSAIKLASRWFPSHRLAFVVGVIVTIAMLGGVVAQTPFTLLANTLGWRGAVLINGSLGVIITLIVYCFVEDYPHGAPQLEKKGAIEKPPISIRRSIFLVLTNKQNSLAGLYTCLLNLPIVLLGELWGVMYLTQVHHLTKAQAASVTMMLFFGTIVGSPLMGWLSDTLSRRRLPMLVSALASLLVVLALMFLPHLCLMSLLILFFLLGFFTSAQIISYPLIAESNPKPLTGTATGLASILIMGGGAVFQPLFGGLMDRHWERTFDHGVALYTPTDYLYGLAIMPMAFLIAFLAAYCLQETYCQPSSED
jgi:sugar phosphate permease